MFHFPKFNPIEFRTQKTPYPTEDWDIYNKCRNNYIAGVGDLLTFAVYCPIQPSDGKIHVQIQDYNSGTAIQTDAITWVNGRRLYAYNAFTFAAVGYYIVKVWYTDPLLGTATYWSERIVCSDDLQYTRLLCWKKSGKWLGYQLNDLFALDSSFCFYKRLDISVYKSRTFGVTNNIFDNGWGGFEIVDTYPLTYIDLHIGYIQGLNDYTQEMCHLLRSMDFLSLDGVELQVTPDTAFDFADADEHEDRRGVTLSKLVCWNKDYNMNILYNPPVEYEPNAPLLLDNGVWNASDYWLGDMIWKTP